MMPMSSSGLANLVWLELDEPLQTGDFRNAQDWCAEETNWGDNPEKAPSYEWMDVYTTHLDRDALPRKMIALAEKQASEKGLDQDAEIGHCFGRRVTTAWSSRESWWSWWNGVWAAGYVNEGGHIELEESQSNPGTGSDVMSGP